MRNAPEGEDLVPPGGLGNTGAGLLLGLLFDLLGLIVFVGLAVGPGKAEGLFQELAGLQAVGASIALGLDGGFALRRDDHFDDARHVAFSVGVWMIGSAMAGGRSRSC